MAYTKMQYKWIRIFLLTGGLLVSFLAHAEYLLGPGDTVRITVYGSPDLTTETRITQDGTLTFPLLGQVSVGGLAIAQSEVKIASMLKAGGFVKQAQVNIFVLQFNSQQVSILGNVLKPGRYPLELSSTLIEVLAQAGGINSNGSDTVTILRQKSDTTAHYEINVDLLFRNGDTSPNFEIKAGDLIYVPRAPLFYIYGEVQRPGAFRLERNMTVAQALAVGGGLTMRGTERGIRIKRRAAGNAMQTIKPQSFDTLQADDVIQVRESLF